MATRITPIPGAIDAVLAQRDLSYQEAGDLAGLSRWVIWRLATRRVLATDAATASRIAWGLDVPGTTLFDMPDATPAESDITRPA